MPRTTERGELLASIRNTYDALALPLAQQILSDEFAALLDNDSSDSDSDSDTDSDLDGWEGTDEEEGEEEAGEEEEDEERQFRRRFYNTGFAVLNALEQLQQRVESRRYVAERTVWRGLKLSRVGILEWYFSMDEKWFRSQFRVNHQGFHMILNLIRNDPVFSNNTRNPQSPVEYQLMVALSRFGHYDNGVSVMSVARDFRMELEIKSLTSISDCIDFTTIGNEKLIV